VFPSPALLFRNHPIAIAGLSIEQQGRGVMDCDKAAGTTKQRR
jgi:hypothetical protein